MTCDTLPHVVYDGLYDPALVAEAARAFPPPDWPHWHRYDGPIERKRVCPHWLRFPPALWRLYDALLGADLPALLGVRGTRPDPGLWGAGLCLMTEGDFLDPHLDSESHPKTGRRRQATVTLYLSACRGGAFDLGGVRIDPAPGRLVAFANAPDAVHSVETVTSGARQSVNLFWYGDRAENPVRTRALFLPPLKDTPEKELARRRRSS